MNNFANRSIFRKLIKLIDGNVGINLRKANDQYKYSKSYTGRDHVLTMLFLQASGCTGLRDIDMKYKKSSKLTKDFKIPTYSQLSRLKYTGVEDMYDYIVTMGSDYSKNKTKHKYREILYFPMDSDEEFRLVTNIFDMSAEDIVSLYKKRWDIELFFKWIKQHLTIKKWVGRSLNAISIQIYSARIIYILD